MLDQTSARVSGFVWPYLLENLMLRKITQSPYLNLLSGLVLLFTSAYETIIKFGEGHIGVHHGVLIFSVIQLVKVFPEIMHGLTEVQEADDRFKEKISS